MKMMKQQQYEWCLLFKNRLFWVLPLLVAACVIGGIWQSNYKSPTQSAREVLTNDSETYQQALATDKQTIKQNADPAAVQLAKKEQRYVHTIMNAARNGDRIAYAAALGAYATKIPSNFAEYSHDSQRVRYLAKHHLPYYATLEKAAPAVNRFVEAGLPGMMNVALLTVVALAAAYFSSLFKAHHHDDFTALLPLNQHQVALNQQVVLTGGLLLALVIGGLLSLVLLSLPHGFGSLKNPFLIEQDTATQQSQLFTAGSLLVQEFLFLGAFILLFTAFAYLLQIWHASFVLSLLLLLAIVFGQQSGLWAASRGFSWAAYLPSAYTNIYWVIVGASSSTSGIISLPWLQGLMVIVTCWLLATGIIHLALGFERKA
ncbi:hypothetical protein ACFQ3L_06590 [Lacticaseibacillus jixianensis]|uniref:ABC transporter permease n=1 Tax=Lacticaseibacillus jixianensis TaxID=2486012 RepID=A0ABW4BAL2_9LACO|nr:hypothetical protein [Lacticaseibacillus jixianensis]